MKFVSDNDYLITARQRSDGAYVFICVCPSVILSVWGEVPCDHYWWCNGPHCTVSHPPASDLRYFPGACKWHVVAITGHLLKLVHFRTPHPPYQHWHLVVIKQNYFQNFPSMSRYECHLSPNMDPMEAISLQVQSVAQHRFYFWLP